MFKSLLITESQFKQIVNEELGISQEVFQISKDVYDKICSDIKTRDSEKIDICNIKRGVVKCSLKDVEFDINYTYRNFLDKNLLKHIDKSGLSEGGTVFLNKNFIICNINLYGIGGSINEEDAMDTIQHEIEHIYQQIMSNKRIPGDDDRYAKMRTDLESNNEVRKTVGRLVYLCYKSEQDAFINGTYAWCMTNDSTTEPYSYRNIKNCPAGKLYLEMKDLYEVVFNNMEMEKIITTEYGLNNEKVMFSIKDFGRKLGKVLVKVNKDKSKIWRK